MNNEPQNDLVVLVADKNMMFALRGILNRHKPLKIRAITSTIIPNNRHDPGCRNNPQDILRSYFRTHRHALVVLDHQGCGGEHLIREKIETDIETLLSKNGWGDRAAAVVISPELEAWVWSDSPAVDEKLGWKDRSPKLRDWLRKNTDYWATGDAKPSRPKEAVEYALREVIKPRSSSIYMELAKSVSWKNCSDPAFAKLVQTLQKWFGV